MRRKLKGMALGLTAMGLVAVTPLTALAASADNMSIGVVEEMRTKKSETAEPGTGKTDTMKPTKAVGQKVGKVTCTSAGKVNISFQGKVTYTDALKVIIADGQGQEINCKITKKNKSLLTVAAEGMIKGQTYTLTIEGIVGKDTTEAVTITKSFVAKGMKTQCKASSAKVENNKFVILKMNGATEYKDATVTVTDADGNVCEAKIVKKAKGNIKIQIAGLAKGKTYTITVNGIKTKKEKNFSSITKKITI